jgi:hypothetical protein
VTRGISLSGILTRFLLREIPLLLAESTWNDKKLRRTEKIENTVFKPHVRAAT